MKDERELKFVVLKSIHPCIFFDTLNHFQLRLSLILKTSFCNVISADLDYDLDFRKAPANRGPSRL